MLNLFVNSGRRRLSRRGGVLSCISVIGLLFLVACTDFVEKIDDKYDDYLASSNEYVEEENGSEEDNGDEISDGEENNENSSSSKNSSSSETSPYGKAAWQFLNPDISYGEITDERDNQVYKTIQIGEQTWIAENLNYEIKNSTCSNDDCGRYGRFYSWNMAVDSAWLDSAKGVVCSNEKYCPILSKIKGVCPSSWRLPTVEDFRILRDYAGGETVAGRVLKSKISPFYDGINEGIDSLGFSALSLSSGYARFWTSEQIDDGRVATVYLWNDYMFIQKLEDGGSDNGLSKDEFEPVRCIKGDVSESEMLPIYGKMTDERDGQIYRTIKVGQQTWMAENLKYDAPGSRCYKGSVDSCAQYGRFYSWASAMDSLGLFNSDIEKCKDSDKYRCLVKSSPVRGICPQGWHAPSFAEWSEEASRLVMFDMDGYPEVVRSTLWTSTAAEENRFIYISGANDMYGRDADNRGYMYLRCIKDSVAGVLSLPKMNAEFVEPPETISYGTLVDARDQQEYKTISIGSQTWMAENLRFDATGSNCYVSDDIFSPVSECEKTDALYSWSDAKEACPAGYHLPSADEFGQLISSVGGELAAGPALRANLSCDEDESSNCIENSKLSWDFNDGTDLYGFSVIPDKKIFWSSTEYYGNIAYAMQFYSSYDVAIVSDFSKEAQHYVRCLKD